MLLEAFKRKLNEPRNDGMLHFSQHLQHDRHAVLYMVYGYPQVDQPWGRMFPLVQGTGIHETIHKVMPELCEEYVPEFNLMVSDGFAYPWTGTVDAFVKYKGENYILDYKTISGAGMMFLSDEPKEDHIWQVSAYHAFRPTPHVKFKTAVMYFPSSGDYKKNWDEPRMLEFEPLPKKDVVRRMLDVEDAIDTYKADGTLPDLLEPSYTWKQKGQTWHLEKRPHYTTMFCPWASLYDDPCGCSKDSFEIIAKWKNDKLRVEPGYDIIVDEIGVPNAFDE